MSAKRQEESAEDLGYSKAMEELEAILLRVEGEEVDIDRLAEELKRAAELLEVCRAKIRKAEVEVIQIVQRLEEPKQDAAATADDRGSEPQK